MSGKTVLLAHGSGGRMTHELVRDLFVRHLDNALLRARDDAAVWSLEAPGPWRLALTTDSYVVSPIFFPGGDIGKLAVCGTVNDLAMMGAEPLYLTAGFIIEEGLALSDLERVVASMAAAARTAGVEIVAGDTKVVDRGKADRLFINTAGVGRVPAGVDLSGANARPGDVVILSGPIGEHGLAVMSLREGLEFSFPLESDCAALNGLVREILRAGGRVRCLRDPTRGGLATTLNEIADQSGAGIEVREAAIPVSEGVRAACELLGLDPLYAANEGKLVAIVDPEAGQPVVEVMRRHPLGREAAVIGRVTAAHPGRVALESAYGSRRVLDMLSGAQLPRIC
ncbi:MAG: hydrogenase expression/formation protein HypE [bacterium]